MFTPLASRAPDLLSCAADLDLAYLSEGATVVWAYHGHYIFIGPAAIESAERLDLIRYPVFNVAQRASLDMQLRAVLANRLQPETPQQKSLVAQNWVEHPKRASIGERGGGRGRD